MDVPFLSKVFIRKLKNVLEHDIFHINHINALNHRETFHKRRERLSLLPLCCVIPQNRVITVQTLRHKIRLHRYMKGVYDTASILAYNQNEFAKILCNTFENKDSDTYYENIFYTMHNNLLRRCAYHQNILRKRNNDDGRTLMFLSSHKMSKKSDGRTNFQNAKFLFRKSQVNINNNKNWKHSTQMRIMHVC